MIVTDEIIILPSAARTSTSSTTIDLKGAVGVLFVLDITAVSGSSPTLNIDFDYNDPIIGWVTLDEIPQQTTTTSAPETLEFPNANWVAIPRDLRVRWVIGGGTPSFTFSMTALVKRDL